MSTSSISYNQLLNNICSFVTYNDRLGDITFERFIDIIHAYLTVDFKFDYITRCEYKMHDKGFPDLVIHKSDITYLIDGKTLTQIYNTNLEHKPIEVLTYIREFITDLINNSFFRKESILINLHKNLSKSDNIDTKEVISNNYES